MTEPTLEEVLAEGKSLRQAFLNAQAAALEAARLYKAAEDAMVAWQQRYGPVASLLEVLK